MKSISLKQFVISLSALLSLFVSSVSACACSHHQAKPETESPSCHAHPAKSESGRNHDADAPETIRNSLSEAGCVCFQIAPKAFAKSETTKFKKYAAAVYHLTAPEIVFVSRGAAVKLDFTKPFYLSDSFYNLSPGRAPPRL